MDKSIVGRIMVFYYSLAKQNVREEETIKEAATSVVGKGSEVDVVIVGAGVAGSALAKDGRRVHVIERDLSEPDRITGEILQPGGYLKLIELGLEDCVNEIDAQQIYGYALFKDGKHIQYPYPLDKFDSDVYGRSFHNGRFVQKMRQKAASLPNVVLEQGSVTCLLEENGVIKGVQYKKKAGDVLKAFAPLTIVCDGGFSNLRRSFCDPKVDVPSCFVGLVLENCNHPYANYAHVIMADPSPLLIYPISNTEIRCMVDVPGMKIPPEIYDSFIAAVDEGNIRTIQNRSMAAAPHPRPGALLMGDALNMRHPLTGGGMTVALSDIVLLRDLLRPFRNLKDAPNLCRYLEAFYILRKPVASTINILAGATYKVFCASSHEAREEMRQAFFDYISLRSFCSTGLISLLSGLNPTPLSLALNLLGVSIYSVGRQCLPFPSPKRIWIGFRLLLVAIGIIFPIVKDEGVRQMFFAAIVPAYYRAPLVKDECFNQEL